VSKHSIGASNQDLVRLDLHIFPDSRESALTDTRNRGASVLATVVQGDGRGHERDENRGPCNDGTAAKVCGLK
jgi:hypothetical protein